VQLLSILTLKHSHFKNNHKPNQSHNKTHAIVINYFLKSNMQQCLQTE